DAAQSAKFHCLNPLAVIEEIDALCLRKNEFEWLQQDAIVGGYHDVKTFRETLNTRLLGAWEQEFYVASGLIQEQQYTELFDHYVQHVSSWVKKERLFNRVTQRYDDPDEKMMTEIERLLEVKQDAGDWRQQLIGVIAAWSLDHPGRKVDASTVFPQHIKRMRDAVFSERRQAVAKLTRDLVLLVREEGTGLDAERRRNAEGVLERMIARFGYCRECATDAATMLLRKRFADLV